MVGGTSVGRSFEEASVLAMDKKREMCEMRQACMISHNSIEVAGISKGVTQDECETGSRHPCLCCDFFYIQVESAQVGPHLGFMQFN